MRRRTAIALGLVLAALSALNGCNRVKEKLAEKAAEKAAEKVVEQATGAEVDLGSSSGSVTVRDPKTGAVARARARPSPRVGRRRRRRSTRAARSSRP